MDKRIGVITFHTPDNYGAVWQAYALQRYLLDTYSSKVEIIDYCTEGHLAVNNVFWSFKGKLFKALVYNTLALFEAYSLNKRKKRFSCFRQRFLRVSRRYPSLQCLLREIEPYDIYISGSDQVFHPESGCREAYYMNWPKKSGRKIAYAPSFGISDFTDKHTEYILPYLEDFDGISCREKSGAEYLCHITGKSVPVVVDPVFLLNDKMWSSILPIRKDKKKCGYIFVYDLNGGYNLIKIAKKIKKETGLPICCVSAMIKKDYFRYCSDYSAGPIEVLQKIRDAEYVITDSFHGTALSLIFNKKVIPFIAYKKGATRITSLMNNLDISRQIVYKVEDFDFCQCQFYDFSEKLNELIQSSLLWLKHQIEL